MVQQGRKPRQTCDSQESTRGGNVVLVRHHHWRLPAAALAVCLAVPSLPLWGEEPAKPVHIGGASSISLLDDCKTSQIDAPAPLTAPFETGPAERMALRSPVSLAEAARSNPDTAGALTDLSAKTAPAAVETADVETLPEAEEIRERYPNGAVRLVRHVVQDERGNYLNHGLWTLYEDNGVVIAEGQFERGAMHGAWRRVFQAGQGEMFRGPLYKKFSPPFTAEATFDHGLLSGPWTVHDAEGRQASSWQFERGQRHGLCQWWFANGQLWREANYQNGRLDGAVRQWTADGELEVETAYVGGRQRDVRIEWHVHDKKITEKKKSEAEMLLKREVVQSEYDFLDGVARHQTLAREGRDERHGRWTAWFESGQRQLEGQYDHDVPTGAWTWWHPNGQMALQGDYVDGRQQGVWTWWHDNGQRSIVGHYSAGQQAGEWTWWNPAGKVMNKAAYVARKPSPGRAAAPHSGLPSPRRPLRQAQKFYVPQR